MKLSRPRFTLRFVFFAMVIFAVALSLDQWVGRSIDQFRDEIRDSNSRVLLVEDKQVAAVAGNVRFSDVTIEDVSSFTDRFFLRRIVKVKYTKLTSWGGMQEAFVQCDALYSVDLFKRTLIGIKESGAGRFYV